MEYTAIEISSPKVARLLQVLDPSHLGSFDYEDLHEQFLVIDWPSVGEYALVKSEDILKTWDHIAPGMKLKFVQFIE